MDQKKLISILALVVIVGLAIYGSSALQGNIVHSVNYLGDYFKGHPFLGGLIFFVISFFAVLLSPFSSVPLVPSAIMAWGSFITFSLILPAWILGGTVAYYLGLLSREKIIRHFISFGKVDYYKIRLSPKSQFWLVFLFRLAIPSEIAGYTLGIIRYDFWKYLLVTLLTELPFAIFVVYSGLILVKGEIFLFGIIALAAAAVFYFTYREFSKRLKKGA
jgi:uncharacterized membrane protein YdjX (TVP38/TMEM64 family)